MIDLDQPEVAGEVDRSGALDVTLASWGQWQRLPATAASVQVPDATTAILVVGMGGSGIAGDVLAAVAADRLDVPVLLHRDADLPSFVGPRTLVLAVSYSGATAEVLAATERALAAGASVVAVTSGGPLAERVAAAGQPVLGVPGGYQPRHALGLLAAALLAACGLDDDLEEAAEAARRVAVACTPDVPRTDNVAKRLGTAIAGCDLVVAWGTDRVAGVGAQRLACQLREHAKLPAYRAVLPELAHNEIVAWQGPGASVGARGLVVLRDPVGETPVARSLVGPARGHVRHRFSWDEELSTGAGPPLVRLAGLTMLVDLVSVYAAIAAGVDPTPISGIDALKATLATTCEEENR